MSIKQMDHLPIYYFLHLFINFSISCFKQVRRLFITQKNLIYVDYHILEKNVLSEKYTRETSQVTLIS